MSAKNSNSQTAAERAAQFLITEARAVDVEFSKYFATSIVLVIAIFAVVHWSHILRIKHSNQIPTAIARSVSYISNGILRISIGKTFGNILILPDHVLLALIYFGVNLTWMFTRVDVSLGTMFAKRCGWLALCNLCLVVFLGLKNTPLSSLVGRSYQNVNVLHRMSGYTTILLTVLHSINVIAGLAKEHLLVYLMEPGQYAGIVGALSLLIVGILGIASFRQRQYELFYILHVALVAIILITSFLHVWKISWSAIAIMIFATSLWFVDRIVRLARWIYHGFGNSCTVMPLPQGATRVVMRRSVQAKPGSHFFLWTPGIRKLQTHPFTLVRNDPAEFVVAAQDGFTKALHDHALQHPQRVLRAAIEGPYGVVPSTERFDKVVLLSGGSGVTFTMALAIDWLNKTPSRYPEGSMEFVWAVKSTSYLRWFNSDLRQLHSSPRVKVSVHVTAENSSEKAAIPPASKESTLGAQAEEGVPHSDQDDVLSIRTRGGTDFISHGRPDLDNVLRHAIHDMSPNSTLLVVACGPKSLLKAARLASRACMSSGSPSIQLHIEVFSG